MSKHSKCRFVAGTKLWRSDERSPLEFTDAFSKFLGAGMIRGRGLWWGNPWVRPHRSVIADKHERMRCIELE